MDFISIIKYLVLLIIRIITQIPTIDINSSNNNKMVILTKIISKPNNNKEFNPLICQLFLKTVVVEQLANLIKCLLSTRQLTHQKECQLLTILLKKLTKE